MQLIELIESFKQRSHRFSMLHDFLFQDLQRAKRVKKILTHVVFLLWVILLLCDGLVD